MKAKCRCRVNKKRSSGEQKKKKTLVREKDRKVSDEM